MVNEPAKHDKITTLLVPRWFEFFPVSRYFFTLPTMPPKHCATRRPRSKFSENHSTKPSRENAKSATKELTKKQTNKHVVRIPPVNISKKSVSRQNE